MADLVTNNNIGNSGVSFTTSELKIGLGNKLLIDAGSVNTIVLGAWNRLMACASTDIQLGTSAEITMAHAANLTLGKSWEYLSDNYTIVTNSDSRSALNQVLLAGGVSNLTKERIMSEQEKAKRALIVVISSFALMVGLSLVSIQYPPFITTINENGQADIVNSQSAIFVILGEILAMLAIFLTQIVIVNTMSDDNTKINAVSNLSLAANGITSAVFSNPENQPQLVLENNPQSKHKYDYYTTGWSASAIVNILPSIPRIFYYENNAQKELYKNWRNPKNGIYPNDALPAIIMASLSFPQQYESDTHASSLNILPDGFIVNSYFNNQVTDFSVQTNKSAEMDILITNYNRGYGGEIFINNKITSIYRNYGHLIEVSVENGNESMTGDNQDKTRLNLSGNYAAVTIDNSGNGIIIDKDNVCIKTNSSITRFNTQQIQINNLQYQESNGYVRVGNLISKSKIAENVTNAIYTFNPINIRIKTIADIIKLTEDKLNNIKYMHKDNSGFSGSINDITNK